MGVKQLTVFVTDCDQCSYREQFSAKLPADTADTAHRNKHSASKLIGAQLKGRVFNPQADELPWFGDIFVAAQYAANIDFAYIHWNGNVYETLGTDMTKPVCSGEDVPGLEKW